MQTEIIKIGNKIEGQKEKILSINILRFLAAVGVMYYHYIFMFTQRNYTSYDYGMFLGLSHYGYLGVDLFFIISGFVIAMSAEGRSLFQFLTSRLARLYPIYWASVIITCIFVYFWGHNIDTVITFKNFLANMTMQPFSFGGYPIDGSYWSLSVELKFYILIGMLLLVGGYKYLEKISIFLSAVLCIGAVSGHIPFNWASYFLAGIIFYNIYKDKLNIQRFISLILLLISSLIYAMTRVPELITAYNMNFSTVIISIHIISFYIIFLFISTKHIDTLLSKAINTVSGFKIRSKQISFLSKEKIERLFIILGSLTFPVYLLHQVIGHIMIKYFDKNDVNIWLSLFITSAFIFLVSYVLNIFAEDEGKNVIVKCMKLLESKVSDVKMLKYFFRKN